LLLLLILIIPLLLRWRRLLMLRRLSSSSSRTSSISRLGSKVLQRPPDRDTTLQMRSATCFQEAHMALAAHPTTVHNGFCRQAQLLWVVTLDLQGCIAVEGFSQRLLEALVLDLRHPAALRHHEVMQGSGCIAVAVTTHELSLHKHVLH
jgi:hypothetical protein